MKEQNRNRMAVPSNTSRQKRPFISHVLVPALQKSDGKGPLFWSGPNLGKIQLSSGAL